VKAFGKWKKALSFSKKKVSFLFLLYFKKIHALNFKSGFRTQSSLDRLAGRWLKNIDMERGEQTKTQRRTMLQILISFL